MAKRLFTSESVTEGHPDKICDQISDAVLDAILAADPAARVACETTVTTGLVHVMGEITTDCYVDIPATVRNVIRDIGYDGAHSGFDYKTCAVLSSIDGQSPDIAMGVNKSLEAKEGDTDKYDTGAGDQGLIFGYACDETPELMPLPIMLAHKMAKRLTEVRKNGTFDYLRPDGKTQVTVEYDDDRNPVRIDAIVVSSQHSADVELEQIREDIKKNVIEPIVPANLMDENTKIFVNPTGRFVIGGPQGDSGLTGRKIIVDTYGGYSRHGGGAFSGKDPTKVDRSAAYAARYVAKNIVAYREENGRFKSRKQLLKVPKLGEKAYTQCAGFLRIDGGENILDNTAVHPESYDIVDKLLKILNLSLEDLNSDKIKVLVEALSQPEVKAFIEANYGPTVNYVFEAAK